jgi:RNA polymerase-binding transcription factor DksA
MTEPRPVTALSPAQRATVRDVLATERAGASEQIAALTRDHAGIVAASAESNADDEHDPEGATIAFEREQLSALLRQARARLEDLDRALDQLAEGTYGVCEHCGEAIAPERLAARPAARTCITCAARRH